MSWTVIEVELDAGLFWFTRCRACQYFSQPHRSADHAHMDGHAHRCPHEGPDRGTQGNQSS